MILKNYIHGVTMMYSSSVVRHMEHGNEFFNPYKVEFLGRFRNCMWLKADSEPWR
jgi:hypothetical protein